MLDLCNYRSQENLEGIRVIEPAAGEGAFAIEIVKRLRESSENHGFCFEKSLENLVFCEIEKENIHVLRAKVALSLGVDFSSLPLSMFICGDFLTSDFAKCDIVIGNPPYVRHEKIPEASRTLYKRYFKTFTHRSDLYIPFFEKGLGLLKQTGQMVYICSNRWMKSQYGVNLRTLIASQYHLKYIIDLEDVDAFEESVLAYAAITSISASENPEKSSFYKLRSLSDLINFSLEQPPSQRLNLTTKNWFAIEYADIGIARKLTSIVEQGFKIGIGVATGRDGVFIGKHLINEVESELLLPIITSKGLAADKIEWQGKYLLNPFAPNGTLIDLQEYPKASQYLRKHFASLSSRHVAKKNPKNWFRTIDRIYPELHKRHKILLPDITGRRFLHIDQGNFYPHHNLYYISGRDTLSLEVLAAILMSDFVRAQLIHVGNVMNGGYPRWQSQNIRKLRIPYLDAITDSDKTKLVLAYRKNSLSEINEIINAERIIEFVRTEGQLRLFDPPADYDQQDERKVMHSLNKIVLYQRRPREAAQPQLHC